MYFKRAEGRRLRSVKEIFRVKQASMFQTISRIQEVQYVWKVINSQGLLKVLNLERLKKILNL